MKGHKAGQRRKEGRSNRRGATRASENALPSSAKVFWRVLDPSVAQDGFQHIICETVEETEALTLYQGLRMRGFPALVSRWEIYRVRILPKSSLDSERFA